MKRNKKQMQILSLCISMVMLILSACGKTEEPIEVMADAAEVEVETEIEELTAIEEEGEEEGKEEETEAEEIKEIEEPLAMVPYYEENKLEFCSDFVISTQAVRTNINDETDMEVADAEWTLESISIEDGEDGKQIITIESECTSYYWTDRKDRQLYSINLPMALYCSINSGVCFPNLNKTGDMELGYIVDDEKWDDKTKTYRIDYKGSSEWDEDGDWTYDEKSGGYIHPTIVHYEDKFVIEPQGYDSLGMIIVPLTLADKEDREDGVHEDDALIKEVLEEREGCYLYSVMDMYAMLNEDSENDSVSDDKGNSSTTAENPKENTMTTNSNNTTTNSGSSKENTTPKQEQPTHTHSYTSSVTKNPTCTEEGVKTYTCSSCGASYTESIPSSGHQWTTTTETISHPSTGHYETVTKKEAFCGCGASGFQSQEELNAHWESGCGGTTGGIREWSEEIWIVDNEPWEETITVTKCAVCGAQG